MKKYLLFIIVIGFALRVISVHVFPVGFTQDEAGIGYDAYSLLKTGNDMWGNSFPLVLRSFGDYKMPLYSYIAIPFVAIFGLNEFTVRLPNAIFGTLAIAATYFMVKNLSKRNDLALVSSTFLATSPWHISLSRGAFEANLTTFFIPIGIWGFIKGLKEPKWMIVSSVAFGLNLFSYHSARVFTPIILFLLLVLFWKNISEQKDFKLLTVLSRYKISIFVLVMFALATIYTMFMGANSRGLDVTIFNPTDQWQHVSDRRYEAVLNGLPDQLARIFSNKAFYVFDTFVSNYAAYLSPIFFFTEGVREWGYGMIPGRGVLYLFEVVFIIASLVAFIIGKKFKGMNFIMLWVILSPIPASLAKGVGFTGNRAAVMMPAIHILSAYGFLVILDLIKQKKFGINLKKAVIIGVIIVWTLSLVTFMEDYIYHTPHRAASWMQYGRREMVSSINEIEENYDNIIISKELSVPHIWVAFYNKWDPTDFQKQSPDWLEYEKQGLVSVDQLGEYRLGKYTFSSIDLNTTNENTLLVGKPEEFTNNIDPTKVVYYPGGEPAVFIVDTSTLSD